MNKHDYNTLDGIKAAAQELNGQAAWLGLDFDFELRPDEGTAQLSVWDRPNGDWTKLWGFTTDCTPKAIADAVLAADAWLQNYLPTLEAMLTRKAEKLEADLLTIRKRIAKAKTENA